MYTSGFSRDDQLPPTLPRCLLRTIVLRSVLFANRVQLSRITVQRARQSTVVYITEGAHFKNKQFCKLRSSYFVSRIFYLLWRIVVLVIGRLKLLFFRFKILENFFIKWNLRISWNKSDLRWLQLKTFFVFISFTTRVYKPLFRLHLFTKNFLVRSLTFWPWLCFFINRTCFEIIWSFLLTAVTATMKLTIPKSKTRLYFCWFLSYKSFQHPSGYGTKSIKHSTGASVDFGGQVVTGLQIGFGGQSTFFNFETKMKTKMIIL